METLPIVTVIMIPVAAHVQTSRGAVSGTVLDQSSAIVRSARVRPSCLQTAAKLFTESN